ncbi:MAG: thioredoxin fold domain-containing protein [Betaproteobacteria bacterium]|nr:thioredoxin fold domain-containing protein [Betaproteobacteria bacterium]
MKPWHVVSIVALALLAPPLALAQTPSPKAIEVPSWFAKSFLDFRDDIADAAQADKRVMVYFHQDGCPYCAKLVSTNFTQRSIVDKMRKGFVAIDINMWGDRETTWLDGKSRPEKELAAHLKVQFTPTILFFDEKGNVVARMNGYYPPHRFEAALDYVTGRKERELPFSEYMKTAVKESASAELHDEPFFMKEPLDLRRKVGGKPLAVVFETPYCSGCDEMHREAFKRREVLEQMAKFDVARVMVGGRSALTTPDGRRLDAGAWARELKVAYTPSVVFFDDRGREVFRIEAYLRPFHLTGSFDYVASGGYREEPSFQRFLQAKAKKIQDAGGEVELWK